MFFVVVNMLLNIFFVQMIVIVYTGFMQACLQALSVAKAEMDVAVKRFQRGGGLSLEGLEYLGDY